MKKSIVAACLLLLLPHVFAANVISIIFDIDKNDNVALTGLDIGDGTRQKFFSDEGPYELLLLDSDGSRVDGHKFDASFILLSDPPQPLDYSSHSYRLLYSNSTEKIIITHNGKVIFEKSLPNKGSPCNRNGICDSGENGFGCFADCGTAPSLSEPTQPPQTNGKTAGTGLLPVLPQVLAELLLVLGAFIIITAVLLFLKLRKK